MTAKFEDILARIDTGPWTWIIFALCSVWGLFGAMQAVSVVFLSPPTDHWCHQPQLEGTNWTTQQVKNITIPWDITRSRYSSCQMYDRNYTAYLDMDFEDVVAALNTSTEVAPPVVVPCTTWEYDTSVFKSTVISEWSLVCDRDYLRSLVQSSFMAGVFVGSPANGCLADRFGRKRLLSVALLLFLAVSLLVAFVQWFPVYLLCRFLMAITGHCVYQTSYIIAVETCSIRHRSAVGILFSVPFALGYILLPGVSYFIRDWRYLHLAISLPAALLIANTVLLPESPRWLIQSGRKTAAAHELQRAARWNRQQPLDSTWLAATIAEIHSSSHRVAPSECTTTAEKQLDSSSKKACDPPSGRDEVGDPTSGSSDGSTIWSSFRALFGCWFMLRITLVLSAVWITCTLVYYGISMNSNNLSADPFLYTLIGGVVELPCYIFGAAFVTRVGRRLTLILSLLITGLAILGPLAVPSADKTSWWFLSVVMVGKMTVTAAFQVLYLYTSELYPTCIRTRGLGVTSMIGRCGAIISPFITDNLGPVYWAFPSIIFGSCSLIAGCLTFLLPETMSQALPDTVHEMKAWSQDKRRSGSSSRAESGPLLNEAETAPATGTTAATRTAAAEGITLDASGTMAVTPISLQLAENMKDEATRTQRGSVE